MIWHCHNWDLIPEVRIQSLKQETNWTNEWILRFIYYSHETECFMLGERYNGFSVSDPGMQNMINVCSFFIWHQVAWELESVCGKGTQQIIPGFSGLQPENSLRTTVTDDSSSLLLPVSPPHPTPPPFLNRSLVLWSY